MSRRRIALIVLALALIAAAALAVTVWARDTVVLSPPGPEAERQMRAVVVGYRTLGEPVRPAKFFGKKLTPIRCVSYMKDMDTQLRAVAEGDAYENSRPGWMTLAGLIRQERDFTRNYGEGTVATSCSGEIGYWEVRLGGGDTYVVRAAVLETMEYGRWDAASRRLTRTGSFSYDEASADELTLRRVDGVWKVTRVRPWMSFNRESGIHPDSA